MTVTEELSSTFGDGPFGQLVQVHLDQMQEFPDRKLDPKTGKEIEAERRPTSSWEVGSDRN